jgi:hypothetical protein
VLSPFQGRLLAISVHIRLDWIDLPGKELFARSFSDEEKKALQHWHMFAVMLTVTISRFLF